MTIGIYEIRNTVDNKVYVGKSRNVEARFKNHVYSLNKGKHCNRHLQNAFMKYGIENFRFSIIEQFESDITEDFLGERELYWMIEFDSHNREFGYNLRLDTSTGTIVHDETRALISELNSGESNPNFGNFWSDSQKDQARVIAKSLHESGEVYGEEWRSKISKSSSLTWSDPEKLKIMAKSVSISKSKYCFEQLTMNGELVKEWDSMRSIIEENPDYHNIAIYSVCAGHKKSYRGFKWLKKSKI